MKIVQYILWIIIFLALTLNTFVAMFNGLGVLQPIIFNLVPIFSILYLWKKDNAGDSIFKTNIVKIVYWILLVFAIFQGLLAVRTFYILDSGEAIPYREAMNNREKSLIEYMGVLDSKKKLNDNEVYLYTSISGISFIKNKSKEDGENYKDLIIQKIYKELPSEYKK